MVNSHQKLETETFSLFAMTPKIPSSRSQSGTGKRKEKEKELVSTLFSKVLQTFDSASKSKMSKKYIGRITNVWGSEPHEDQGVTSNLLSDSPEILPSLLLKHRSSMNDINSSVNRKYSTHDEKTTSKYSTDDALNCLFQDSPDNEIPCQKGLGMKDVNNFNLQIKSEDSYDDGVDSPTPTTVNISPSALSLKRVHSKGHNIEKKSQSFQSVSSTNFDDKKQPFLPCLLSPRSPRSPTIFDEKKR